MCILGTREGQERMPRRLLSDFDLMQDCGLGDMTGKLPMTGEPNRNDSMDWSGQVLYSHSWLHVLTGFEQSLSPIAINSTPTA